MADEYDPIGDGKVLFDGGNEDWVTGGTGIIGRGVDVAGYDDGAVGAPCTNCADGGFDRFDEFVGFGSLDGLDGFGGLDGFVTLDDCDRADKTDGPARGGGPDAFCAGRRQGREAEASSVLDDCGMLLSPECTEVGGGEGSP